MTKPLGFILEEKISPIDGAPIAVILTLNSSNRKTGNMAQVWIIRTDMSPVEAVNNGDDYSICGDCPHRKQQDGTRSCYVNVGQAPNSVYKAYHNNKYRSDLNAFHVQPYLKGRKVRWGAYGDPALVSPVVFKIINRHAAGHTGYTHQWREEFAQWATGSLQASCDGMVDYLEASRLGWRTFNVIAKGAKPYSGKLCPATANNSKATCLTCTLCDGAKADIFVEAHGSGAKHVVTAA